MMEEILSTINNYFYRFGEIQRFKIENNKIEVKGQYFTDEYVKIEGSLFNDGVHKIINVVDGNKIELSALKNEEFTGAILALAIPKMIIDLENEFVNYRKENKPTNVQSESFGNYSYSKVLNKDGTIAGFLDIHKSDLKQFRKLYDSKRGVKFIWYKIFMKL